MKKENLIGKKFGRLTVIEESENSKHRTQWKCQCECGIIKIIKSENLKNGTTKSCGCLNIEKMKNRSFNLYKNNIKYSPRESTARRIWKSYKKDGLSFEDFYRLSQEKCYYCGNEPNNIQNSAKQDKKSSQYAKDNGDFIYNGLDRIDNTKLHTVDNCVPCCKWCNYAKRERTVEEFKEWIKKLYINLK